jgi:hypothetical protein
MILVMRGALALFFLGVGVVLVASDDVAFGVFAIAVAVVNAVLIIVIAQRARRAP